VKVREILRLLRANGFNLTRQKGSHRRFERGSFQVTVSGHESDEIRPKTLRSIMKQAGLTPELK